MNAYYNEHEPFVVDWLKNLIAAGQLPAGAVDGRDIREVSSADLRSRHQAHFFAGIGGWSYALRLAGWPDVAPVWTGSCPCQPFSMAGRKKGFADERHLWPVWFQLIAQCRPPIVFGEQVASPDGLRWLDTVFDDLEREGYAVGAANLCAAGIGAPHIRQRLYFVAVSGEQRRQGFGLHLRQWRSHPAVSQAAGSGPLGDVADANCGGGRPRRTGDTCGRSPVQPHRYGSASELGDPCGEGLSVGPKSDDRPRTLRLEGAAIGAAGPFSSAWSPADLLWCRDGKYRPVEPGTFPLAHGVPGRVGKLRAYGNAIVPQVAATFVRAAVESFAGALA